MLHKKLLYRKYSLKVLWPDVSYIIRTINSSGCCTLSYSCSSCWNCDIHAWSLGWGDDLLGPQVLSPWIKQNIFISLQNNALLLACYNSLIIHYLFSLCMHHTKPLLQKLKCLKLIPDRYVWCVSKEKDSKVIRWQGELHFNAHLRF